MKEHVYHSTSKYLIVKMVARTQMFSSRGHWDVLHFTDSNTTPDSCELCILIAQAGRAHEGTSVEEYDALAGKSQTELGLKHATRATALSDHVLRYNIEIVMSWKILNLYSSESSSVANANTFGMREVTKERLKIFHATNSFFLQVIWVKVSLQRYLQCSDLLEQESFSRQNT